MNGILDKLKTLSAKDRLHIKRVAAAIVCAVLLVAAGMLIYRHLVNEHFISQYRKESYEIEQEKGLLSPNVPEGYITYYNLGNGFYREEDYESAVYCFMKALEYNPPHDPPSDIECDVRINLALAFIGMIDFEHIEAANKKEEAIELLLAARSVLTEEDCACVPPESAEGHNETAEQLKKEIDEMLEKLGAEPLQENESESENSDEDSSSSDSESPKQSSEEKRLQEKAQQERREALQEQQKAQQERNERKEQERRQKEQEQQSSGGSGDDENGNGGGSGDDENGNGGGSGDQNGNGGGVVKNW